MKKQAKGTSAKIRTLTVAAMLFAASLVLAVFENMLPPLPIPIPGVRLGLSNIPVMYSLFFASKKQAFAIAILKSFFVFSTRGLIAGTLSLCGGFLSLIIMTLLFIIFKERISYMVISIFGAVFHNIGQLAAVSVIYTSLYIWVNLPILFLFGIAAGVVTATLLKFVLPAFKRLDLK